VPSLVAREQTYTEAVAAADKERFEKLTAVMTEGSGDSYGREAVVDVGYDALGEIGDDEGGDIDDGSADRMQVGRRWAGPSLKCALVRAYRFFVICYAVVLFGCE
jgi:hypothetical protein